MSKCAKRCAFGMIETEMRPGEKIMRREESFEVRLARKHYVDKMAGIQPKGVFR